METNFKRYGEYDDNTLEKGLAELFRGKGIGEASSRLTTKTLRVSGNNACSVEHTGSRLTVLLVV